MGKEIDLSIGSDTSSESHSGTKCHVVFVVVLQLIHLFESL